MVQAGAAVKGRAMYEGYVYFVFAPKVRRIKIGYSASHPESRFLALQTGSPVRLRRLGYVRGGVENERDFHYQFSAHRKCGEWFDAALELRAYVRVRAWRWEPVTRQRLRDEAAVREVYPAAILEEGQRNCNRAWPGTWRYNVVDDASRMLLGEGVSEAKAWLAACAAVRLGWMWYMEDNGHYRKTRIRRDAVLSGVCPAP